MKRLTQAKFDDLIKVYTPRDWTVTHEPERQLDATGVTDWDARIIHIPSKLRIITALSFLHEVGHIIFRHHPRNQVCWVEEYEAETYAIETLQHEGFDLSENMIKKSRIYLRKEYNHHFEVCEAYGVEPTLATIAQERWMD